MTLNQYSKLTAKAKKALPIFKKLKKQDVSWFNAQEIADKMGYCRFWVSKKISNGTIKSKIDSAKGTESKVYRIVHIDWVIEFLDGILKKKPDKVLND